MAVILDTQLPLVKSLYYQKHLSAREIAKTISAGLGAVYYFMRKHDLRRRSFSEQNKVRFEARLPSFTLKKLNSANQRELKAAGTFLYWAEGYKRGHLIDFANSDVDMIKIFIKFLRNVCGIKESKLRIKLFCYPNQEIKALQKFWSKVVAVPLSQFHRPYVRNDFNEKNIGRLPYGLIHVIYCDKKLLLLIKKWIDEYTDTWAVT